MKKTGRIIIVFLMAMGVTACGQRENTSQNNSEPDSSPANRAADVTEERTEDDWY